MCIERCLFEEDEREGGTVRDHCPVFYRKMLEFLAEAGHGRVDSYREKKYHIKDIELKLRERQFADIKYTSGRVENHGT